MKYTVYVLFSVLHHKIYIGYSSDVENRILSHNELATKGFTVKYRPWKLVYQEEFETKSAAIKRKKQLKSASGRLFIWNLIAQIQ